jgi:hypothetical protein
MQIFAGNDMLVIQSITLLVYWLSHSDSNVL